MPARRHIPTYLCAILILSACSTGQEVTVKIEESPQGAVYLKRISDRSFQAAHPIKIDPSIIALLLNGILIRDDQGTMQKAVGPPDVRRAFSGSEVGYLAPVISDGLRRAASDQQVAFRGGASGPSPSPRESTTGVLYAYGRSLYVTLTHYRSKEDAATTADTRMPDTAGAVKRNVSFIPESAKRPDSFLDSRSTDDTLVIDYELLALLPPASLPSISSTPAAPPAPSNATNGGQTEPTRDAEIEALRKELQDIKRQLAEQDAERARLQQKNAVPQR